MIGRRGRRGTRAGAVAGALVLVLALAGCQTGGTEGAGAGAGGGGDVAEDLPDVSGDSSTLVAQVSTGGGFVPFGYYFSSVPTMSVYADGTAVLHGPMTMQYPGKALPNLQVVQLPDDALDRIVQAALDADLFGPAPEYGAPNVTDLPSTVVTIVVGGETFVHSAYALGVGPGEGPGSDDMFGGGDSGLTDEQSAVRVKLARFVEAVNAVVTTTDTQEPYRATAVGVMAVPIDPEAAVSDDFTPSVRPWPVPGVALADAGTCALVDGDDARVLLTDLEDADELTQFEQDGVVYDAWFRLLLPHEKSCADLPG